MDSISQFVLGGAVGYLVGGKQAPRQAIIAGGLLATLPDLDVLLDYGDALQNTIQHRTWSHSWLLQTAFSPLAGWLLSRIFRSISFARWSVLVWLAWVTHGALDGCTIYGTHLFWPLDVPSVIWANLFIIDPLFTLPLLVGVGGLLLRPWSRRARRAIQFGAALSAVYVAWSVVAKVGMTQRFEDLLAQEQLSVSQVIVSPAPLNTLLWRGLAVSETAYYEVLMSVFDGEVTPTINRYPRHPALAQHLNDNASFADYQHFSHGFYALAQRDNAIVIKDLRMGLSPYLPFQFALAQLEKGQAVAVTPYRVRGEGRMSWSGLGNVFQRVVNSAQSVP